MEGKNIKGHVNFHMADEYFYHSTGIIRILMFRKWCI